MVSQHHFCYWKKTTTNWKNFPHLSSSFYENQFLATPRPRWPQSSLQPHTTGPPLSCWGLHRRLSGWRARSFSRTLQAPQESTHLNRFRGIKPLAKMRAAELGFKPGSSDSQARAPISMRSWLSLLEIVHLHGQFPISVAFMRPSLESVFAC